MILRNNEKVEVLLVDFNHILLKTGDNELELSPRRLEIALNEIEERKLNIEVVEEETSKKRGSTNASKIENKGKATE
jgi:hypothetical protein